MLTSVGFIEKKEKGVLQIVPDADNLKRVEEGVRQLQRAMDDLNIPEDDRPVIPPNIASNCGMKPGEVPDKGKSRLTVTSSSSGKWLQL